MGLPIEYNQYNAMKGRKFAQKRAFNASKNDRKFGSKKMAKSFRNKMSGKYAKFASQTLSKEIAKKIEAAGSLENYYNSIMI